MFLWFFIYPLDVWNISKLYRFEYLYLESSPLVLILTYEAKQVRRLIFSYLWKLQNKYLYLQKINCFSQVIKLGVLIFFISSRLSWVITSTKLCKFCDLLLLMTFQISHVCFIQIFIRYDVFWQIHLYIGIDFYSLSIFILIHYTSNPAFKTCRKNCRNISMNKQ